MKLIQLKNKLGELCSPKIDCPIGSIKIFSGNMENEIQKYYYGIWERFGDGKVLVGVDENDINFSTSGKTGGEKNHQLIRAELPVDRLKVLDGRYFPEQVQVGTYSDAGLNWPGIRTNTEIGTGGLVTEKMGEGKTHNNLQPYITVYFYVRIS